jgi:hypothetical protein
VGTVAAMGVAIGAIGSAIAYFLGLFKGIAPWQFPLMIIGLALLISGPSLILAYMKLRKRNLGPILDANGWAVNARARINVPFGASLTGIASLPAGSTVDVSDRYAEKAVLWPKLLIFLFFLWWAYAFLDDTGILFRLTSTWETPIGKPPAALRVNPGKPQSQSGNAAPLTATNPASAN